jgi:hypothetical protein
MNIPSSARKAGWVAFTLFAIKGLVWLAIAGAAAIGWAGS